MFENIEDSWDGDRLKFIFNFFFLYWYCWISLLQHKTEDSTQKNGVRDEFVFVSNNYILHFFLMLCCVQIDRRGQTSTWSTLHAFLSRHLCPHTNGMWNHKFTSLVVLFLFFDKETRSCRRKENWLVFCKMQLTCLKYIFGLLFFH